jgi:hypothetical protein
VALLPPRIEILVEALLALARCSPTLISKTAVAESMFR